MCLTMTSGYRTAKRDITCFKIVLWWNGNPLSQYRGFRYQIGKIHTSKRLTSHEGAIYRGFHSYKEAKRYPDETGWTVRCRIPKGTRYVIGLHGHMEGYVSEAIILERVYPNYGAKDGIGRLPWGIVSIDNDNLKGIPPRYYTW